MGFGVRLEVQSQVFDAGPLSVLTVHRIRPVTELDPEVGEPTGPEVTVEHDVDLVDDVNGAGLLYFASFLSVVERVQLRRWRSLGRSGRSFLERRVSSFRICYLGNADLDTTLSIQLRTSSDPRDATWEKSDLQVRDVCTNRTVAVVSATRFGPGRQPALP